MTLLEAAILGVVEGVTEYLPVSSTGHLILAEHLMGLDEPPAVKVAVDRFTIVIQLGAILAVLGLYRTRVLQMVRGMMGRDTGGLRLAVNIVLAALPALVAAKIFKERIETQLFHPGPVLGALAVGGAAMLAIGPWQRRTYGRNGGEGDSAGGVERITTIDALTPQKALVIGLIQCLALWPGTSRSMVTIVAGMLVGLRPKQAAEFSFLLGLPTLGAACGYNVLRTMNEAGPTMFEVLGIQAVVVGILVATVSAALAVAWLVRFLNRHGLAIFGWYRLALCGVFGVLIMNGYVGIAPDGTVDTRSTGVVVPAQRPPSR